MNTRSAQLDEISSLIGINYQGSNALVQGLNLCNRKTIYDSIISYTTSSKYFEYIDKNKSIKAVFLTKQLYDEIIIQIPNINDRVSFFITDNPEVSFYQLHTKLYFETPFYDHFEFETVIGKDCNIDPSAVIEPGVIIGDRVTIGPLSVVRRGSIIDDDVQIGCNTVIGSEGFQSIKGMKKVIKHVGGTHIYPNVCVGDLCTIGNMLFEGCVEVGENTKFDNHVHFAHNCSCGRNCTLTAGALLMGSVTLGNDVWLAPASVILNQCVVEDGAFVGTLTYVNKNVPQGKTVVGIPSKILEK